MRWRGDFLYRRFEYFYHRSRQTSRVSLSNTGEQANDDSFSPALSADGRYVAFQSQASTMVLGDTNFRTDVFVHDQTGQPPGNLLFNAGFELDANGDTFPDGWSHDPRATRSSAVVHSGDFALQHSASDDATYGIVLHVPRLQGGTFYDVAGWLNIPPTSDVFSLQFFVQWRDASNGVLGTDVGRTFSAPTAGWELAVARLEAPAGTAYGVVGMAVSSLNTTLYVDDVVMLPSASPAQE